MSIEKEFLAEESGCDYDEAMSNTPLTKEDFEWFKELSLNNQKIGFIINDEYELKEVPFIMQGYEGDFDSGINILYNYDTLEKTYDSIAFECVRQATKEEIIMFVDGYKYMQ